MHYCAASPCRHRPASSLHRIGLLALLAAVFGSVGCSVKKEPPKPVVRYQTLPTKEVPDFLKGTILEHTDLTNTEPFLVSGYGLIANLPGTGDSRLPNAVRDHMLKELTRHGFGSSTMPEFENATPERILRDNRFAVVEVLGYLPPGIRKGDWFDVQVSVLPDNDTKSLSGGDLYQTDLRLFGANPRNPAGAVNVYARAQGPVFVNPAFAFETNPQTAEAKRSLRHAVILDGGRAMNDRPLILRLRRPQFSLSRQIELRLDERFQELPSDSVAAAQDEGAVHIFVPRTGPWAGDWEHFAQVALHTYMNGSAAFAAHKARELAEEAVKPDAPLMDISYCWEALGAEALPVARELMTHGSPDVAYAAMRAAVFLGDSAAPRALAEVARTPEHPFRLNAIETLGKLPSSPAINELLRPLLDVPETTVRIAAYRVLARNRDATVFSTPVQEKFVLDIVRSSGPPIIYASRRGMPRIALIGRQTALDEPTLFVADNNQLSITSEPDRSVVTIYHRSSKRPRAITVPSSPDLAEVIARLAGAGAQPGMGLNFNYSQIVAILHEMAEQRMVSAETNGQRVAASFMLQEVPQVQAEVFSAPPIDAGRPQGDEMGQEVGMTE